MNRNLAVFLRALLVLVGAAALTLLLWEPHIEGRNAHATLFAIYFKDPFLAYACVASIPFFMGLYQAHDLLGCAARGQAFPATAARALQKVRYCAFALIGFVAVGQVIIMMNDSDDRAGGVFIGFLIAFASSAVVVATVYLERLLAARAPNEH